MKEQPLGQGQTASPDRRAKAAADRRAKAAATRRPPASESHGLSQIVLEHDPDSEPPETGYGNRPEEYNPDDFE